MSPEALIAVVSNLETLPTWMTHVEAVERLDSERACARERLGRHQRHFKIERIALSDTQVALRATRRPFSFEARFTTAPDTGGARIVYSREATPIGVAKTVVARVLRPRLERAWSRWMRREIRLAATLAANEMQR